MSKPEGIKVHCESPYWSAQLQLILERAIGCKWGYGIKAPWNIRRKYLIITKNSDIFGWYFTWATEADFEECEFPYYTAKKLVKAYEKLH